MRGRGVRVFPMRWRRFRQGIWVGIGTACAVLLLWWGQFFAQARLTLTNAYYVPAPVSGEIAIIAIDDASLRAYGRSPGIWPRTLFVDLLNRLTPHPPRVIAFDLLFSEPTADDAALSDAIARLRSGDGRVRTVMAAAGIERSPLPTQDIPAITYSQDLRPSAAIRGVMDYAGYVNTFPDADRTIRRQTSLVMVNGAVQPSFSLAIYLAYLRVPAAALNQVVLPDGNHLVVAGERRLRVDDFGLWMGNYFGSPANRQTMTFPTYSLRDVLTGDVDPALFEGKIVLVGLMNNTGSEDKYFVPIGSGSALMSGVEIHANSVETLLQNVPLYEQSALSQAVIIIGLSLIASLIYAQRRWYAMLAAAAGMVMVMILVAFMRFGVQREVINLFHALVALGLPLVIHLLLNIVQETLRRQHSEFLLQSVGALSSQQLALEKIPPLLAADLRMLLPTASGMVLFWNDAINAVQAVHTWSPGQNGQPRPFFDHLWNALVAPLTGHRPKQWFSLPVEWQGRLRAKFALFTDAVTYGRAEVNLSRFAREVAPHLENAMLFAEVQRQRAFLETVLRHSPSAVAIAEHPSLILRQRNTAFDRMFSAENSGQASETPASLLDHFSHSGVEAPIVSRLKEGFAHATIFRQELPYNDGTFILDAALLPGQTAWVVLLTDITVQAQLSELKTRMIRMASHDLKNPLVIGVLGFANLILQDPDPAGLSDENRHHLEQIVRSGNEMLGIINDILSLEQIREGLLKRASCDLFDLTQEVIRQHSDQIHQKGLLLAPEIEERLPLLVVDARKLRQAMSNLLSNAIKYTPEGGRIVVRLALNGERVCFEVEDSGYGIPEWAQKHLYGEFYRATTSATAHIHGTGLGLSIVKSVIEAHDGQVWFCSQEGEGSTFGFWLPVMHIVTDTDAT